MECHRTWGMQYESGRLGQCAGMSLDENEGSLRSRSGDRIRRRHVPLLPEDTKCAISSIRSLATRLGLHSFQCPSETTSTVPSTTVMAVSSSIAYAGPEMPAAHCSASAIELPGMPS